MAEAKTAKSAATTAKSGGAGKPTSPKQPKGAKPGRSAATPAAAAGEAHCRNPKCKQPVRAKGYCRKHFIAWRREGVGDHHRYKVCSKEACRKPREFGGLCAEHAGKGAPAEGGAAAAAT